MLTHEVSRREMLSSTLFLPLVGTMVAAPKVLLVVAHPDDEYYFAASVYRITQELGGVVDQVVITNGAAGFRYAQLAERFYGVSLTTASDGRSRLPAIRKEETLRAGRVLGIRKHFFLDESDNRFTLDSSETLDGVWDTKRISGSLDEVMRAGSYDFVFVVLPRAETHGHHQAASQLALEAVARIPAARQPIVLGAEPGSVDKSPAAFRCVRAEVYSDAPLYTLDRTRTLAADSALRYEIVVNWVVAEHKSQGLFQTENRRHNCERFWLFRGSGPNAKEHADRLFNALAATIE